MKHNKLSELSNVELERKKKTLSGIFFGLIIAFGILLSLVIYIFVTKGFEKHTLPAIIPLISIPLIFLPMFINYQQIQKELQSRNAR